jgi:hypothetical protein
MTEYFNISERRVQLKLKGITNGHTFIGIYSPEEGKPRDEIEQFYNTLQEIIQNINKREFIV